MKQATITVCDTKHLSIVGDLTFDTVTQLYNDSLNCFTGENDFVIDLSDVVHSDSAGIALLIEWRRRARQYQCSLRFINLSDQMKAMINVCGLSDLF